ncbi:hypothetical protein RRF57_006704 [Xylaria bambusicola]|uniref:Uncharacterized protein n=1 Tax=Xylaria bambusicola TaxID=326684 RepID=A0AAN7USZ3_9PEZI
MPEQTRNPGLIARLFQKTPLQTSHQQQERSNQKAKDKVTRLWNKSNPSTKVLLMRWKPATPRKS